MTTNLKEIRTAKGLTQAQLAELVQVSRQTVISIESGRYIPSVLLALKISYELSKKVEEIFKLEKIDL